MKKARKGLHKSMCKPFLFIRMPGYAPGTGIYKNPMITPFNTSDC